MRVQHKQAPKSTLEQSDNFLACCLDCQAITTHVKLGTGFAPLLSFRRNGQTLHLRELGLPPTCESRPKRDSLRTTELFLVIGKLLDSLIDFQGHTYASFPYDV